jgi:hypothetical protein
LAFFLETGNMTFKDLIDSIPENHVLTVRPDKDFSAAKIEIYNPTTRMERRFMVTYEFLTDAAMADQYILHEIKNNNHP